MWIEETANGKFKFVEQYKDALTGKRKRVSVTYSKCTNATKKQALLELAQKIEEKNKVIDTDNLTLKELCDYYLEDKKLTTKESSFSIFKSHVRNVLAKLDGDLMISKINTIQLQEKIKKLNNSNIIGLKLILGWGYKKGYINTPLAFRIEGAKKNTKQNKLLYLEKSELIEVLEELNANAHTYNQQVIAYLIEALSLTGLRIGELLALEEDDIVNSTISVNKRIYAGKIDIPKNGITRTIAVNKRMVQIKNEVLFLKRINRIDTKILFASAQGGYIARRSIAYALKKIDIRLHPHLFRHTHASLLAEQGVPLEMIQRRLGHKNDRITKEIYIHVTKKQKAKEEELFKGLEIL